MAKPVEIIPALNYYNIIADQYDDFMLGDSEQRVREMVSNEFMKTIPAGNILDFGGGTGQDLPWLLRHHGYHVFFFEPSYNMRSIAQKNISMCYDVDKPAFIGQNLPISNWTDGHLPTYEKMNGILANFAVLNCIPNIEEFFDKLSLICNSGCHVMATVLNASFAKMVTKYPLKTAMGALLSGRATIYNNYKGKGHATYLHTVKQFKAAAERHFVFDSCIPLKISDFALIKFVRK
jgi:hypothetical protein